MTNGLMLSDRELLLQMCMTVLKNVAFQCLIHASGPPPSNRPRAAQWAVQRCIQTMHACICASERPNRVFAEPNPTLGHCRNKIYVYLHPKPFSIYDLTNYHFEELESLLCWTALCRPWLHSVLFFFCPKYRTITEACTLY